MPARHFFRPTSNGVAKPPFFFSQPVRVVQRKSIFLLSQAHAMAGRDDTAGRDETKSRMWGDWCLDNRVVAPALQQAFAAVMALVALSPVRLVAQRLRLWFSAAGTKYLVVLKPECLDGTHLRSISSLLTDGSTLELNLLELPANPPAKVDLARRNAESLFPPRSSDAAKDPTAYILCTAIYYLYLYTGANFADVVLKKVNVCFGLYSAAAYLYAFRSCTYSG